MTDDAASTADAAALESRLAAVERAIADGETGADGLPDAAALAARVDELESTVERLDDRTAELEAATRALRGYVGGVRAVNESVERRADAALAAVESLEAALRDDSDAAVDAVAAAGAAIADGDGVGSGGEGEYGENGEGGDGDGHGSRSAALAARLRDAS